jgi:outer membrane immunogenic protein
VAAFSLAASSFAFAADIARKAPPPPPAPPAPSWTGWYVGLNAGWVDVTGGGNTNATSVSFTDPSHGGEASTTTTLAAAATNQFGNRSNGFLGGGQFGYNYQFASPFVVGFEADIQGSSARGSATVSNSVLTDTTRGPNTATWNTSTTVSRDLDYLGTVRGRIGWTATPTFLLYGTGGLAYGGVSSNTSMTINATRLTGEPVFGVPTTVTSGSFSDTRTGWTAGGGVEWMFLPNWSAKVEYLHYDLGSVTYGTSGFSIDVGPTALPGLGIAAIATSTTINFRGDIVRAGVNYKFGGPY